MLRGTPSTVAGAILYSVIRFVMPPKIPQAVLSKIGDTKFVIDDAYNDLVKARSLVHSFSVKEVEAMTAPGIRLAEQALKEGNRALDEVQARTRWLIMAMVGVLLAASLLHLKIRAIEKR